MAEAIPCEGSSFHGVVHTVDAEFMEKLDKIEMTYIRKTAKAKMYDGSIRDVSVYCRNEDEVRNAEVDKPPTQRYLEIIMQGCEHYGVSKEHIDMLKALPNQPRKTMDECKKFTVTEDMKVFTEDELKQGDGKEGRPLLAAVNGKVIKCIATQDHPKFKIFCFAAGQHADFLLARMLYDPKFGVP